MELVDTNEHTTASEAAKDNIETLYIKVADYTYKIHIDYFVNKAVMYISSDTGEHIKYINTNPIFNTTRQVYKHLVKELKHTRKYLQAHADELKSKGF